MMTKVSDKKIHKGYYQETELDKILPTVSPHEPYINALARAPLPPKDLVGEANLIGTKSLQAFCMMWAMHVIAGAHVQTKSGERFEGPTHEQGSFYDPHITLWWDKSKCKDGGAMRLTQSGINNLMYGKKVIQRIGVTANVPKDIFITNGGVTGSGYRVIQAGKVLLDFYEVIARKIRYAPLRQYFLDIAAGIRREMAVPKATRPALTIAPGMSLMARVTYGTNRRVDASVHDVGGKGYVNVSVREAGLQTLLQYLFGTTDVAEPRARVHMTKGGTLVLVADPNGWKITDAGTVQASTLSSADIPQPTFDENLVRFANIPVGNPRPGVVTLDIPGRLFAHRAFGGSGCPSATSNGSAPGRARTKVDVSVTYQKVDTERAVA